MKRTKPTQNSITFPVIEARQPIGVFYIGVMSARDVCDITFYDVRRIEGEREIENYLGIQRPLNKKRVKDIKEYVQTTDASFPTSIIIAVDQENASLSKDRRMMTLSSPANANNRKADTEFLKIARVLDGQHRIEGLSEYKGSDFFVNVAVFIGMDLADQANVFSTVNLAQTKVNKSLAYDLFGLARHRSPQKSCHLVAVMLNEGKDSPFRNRIKRLGVATEGRFDEMITQATLVESILNPYISTHPNRDREKIRRGSELPLLNAEDSRQLIFRNMFIREREVDIARVVSNYFASVSKRWPKAWENSGEGNILNRTNGFRGFMRFLRPAYLWVSSPGRIADSDQFYSVMKQIRMKDSEFRSDEFKPGTSGEVALFHRLEAESGISDREMVHAK